MSYKIKLDQFEGPFDLLLFFIERDELDIHDIPIAQITENFLSYIRQLESLDLDVASEFILVAANLMRIKARVLLPRRALDEFGNEIDPRKELAQKLLEYKRYKEVLEDFELLEAEQSKLRTRGNAAAEIKQLAQKALIDIELESLSMFTLLKAFQKVMKGLKEKDHIEVHKIYDYAYDIEDQTDFILDKLVQTKRMKFTALFEFMENRVHAIVTFLALLNMLNEGLIQVTIGEGHNNFWIQKSKDEN